MLEDLKLVDSRRIRLGKVNSLAYSDDTSEVFVDSKIKGIVIIG